MKKVQQILDSKLLSVKRTSELKSNFEETTKDVDKRLNTVEERIRKFDTNSSSATEIFSHQQQLIASCESIKSELVSIQEKLQEVDQLGSELIQHAGTSRYAANVKGHSISPDTDDGRTTIQQITKTLFELHRRCVRLLINFSAKTIKIYLKFKNDSQRELSELMHRIMQQSDQLGKWFNERDTFNR